MSQNTSVIVMDGYVAPGYERVASQFMAHLSSGEEQGAALCVTKDQEIVVDLWGGYSDVCRETPWKKDTACLMFSVTKGLAAIAMMQLQEAGKFDYDQPVADIWPEFAQNGKADITIRTLMNHRAGLAAIDHVFSMQYLIDPANADDVATILARQTPLWEPGKGQAYHGTTYGMYLGELFRRLSSQSFSDYFQEHIAGPLGADVWVGAPQAEPSMIAEIEAPSDFERIKGMIPHMIMGGTAEGNIGRSFLRPGGLPKRALLNPELDGGGPERYNLPEVRQHPILWAGGIGTARGIAQIFGAMANSGVYRGTRLVDGESLIPVYKRQGWSKLDGVLGKPVGWSQGFLKDETGVFSPNEDSFGHAGLGGGLGWSDPINRLSIGYVTNKLDWRIRSPRCIRLCQATYDSVALIARGSNYR